MGKNDFIVEKKDFIVKKKKRFYSGKKRFYSGKNLSFIPKKLRPHHVYSILPVGQGQLKSEWILLSAQTKSSNSAARLDSRLFSEFISKNSLLLKYSIFNLHNFHNHFMRFPH